MRFHTYKRFSPESADAVDLQALLDGLADFLLQSGFAGGGPADPWGIGEPDQGGDRSLDALKQAILDALIQSGQFTPEMLEALRGEGDEISEAKHLPLAKHTIDTIAMLQDKTKGNLNPEEKRFLDTILADLRWRYVKTAE